ncbi:hypothetical protein GGS23DRAFT_262611 [Durotheca rogersii]|uniref:uncharacterized protein n=1 Tax=Durotheca rogersii TaxID=419775 RepID=UPI00221F51CC|nr:uncharacterized protein GGS23DRAFT_262611 [Durotheca rogersii]KAI5859824.1 hypothetical protein GGS23DRAFT_262611 [Durotheca rogersii]
MAAPAFGNGWNPQFGWDPRTSAGYGNPISGVGIGGAGDFMSRSFFSAVPGGAMFPGPNIHSGYHYSVPVFPGMNTRLQTPHPVVDYDAPALNLSNSTGGVGCEPGYNYFFPPEHTKLHIIKSSTAPWRLPEGASMSFGAYHVPVHTTLSDLMLGFGATNPIPQQNRVTEIIQGGNGKWYRGVTFSGEDLEQMAKTLRDLGWDRSRTGRTGEKPVVWLWITKD